MMTSEGAGMMSARAPQTAVMKPVSMLERGVGKLQEWCRVTALDLSAIKIGGEGAGRLAAVLPECTSLAHLDLGWNGIGDEGAGRLAAVLPQCTSLAYLHLGYNDIGAEGAGRLRTAALPSLYLTV
jgi:Ran GTPase-activating protein (RanGAP) involved in mRNA processing and transport